MHRIFPWFALLTLAAATSAAHAADTEKNDPWVESHLSELLSLYQHLHSHPELSFKEVNTSQRIAEELRKAGADVTTGVGKLGVVAVLKNGQGPTVLVRTDLDALPLTEATGLPFASEVTAKDDEGNVVGVMHACGHDVHMTSLVGTARWLADHKDRWAGTAVLIGQPAEEKIGGAKAMLADGLYTRFPKPDYALALHVAHDLETGKVGYRSGPAMAGSTSLDVLVRGKGGHGAMPHNTVDPIVLAALMIVDWQTIVSREINPVEPAVLTVGSIHGGTKHNIIPSEVRLQLTLRSFSESVGDQLIDGIKRRSNGLAQAHRAPAPSFSVVDSTPPTINTPSLVQRVVPALTRELGESNVEESELTMGAEDFGLYSQGGVPIFMFRLGTIPPARMAEARAKGEKLPSLHSPLYKPDAAPSLRTGVRAMTAAVTSLLPAR
ncbi:MAG TPA: amidohydrolase [Isosphaeraceae bacterium]|jgi:hippurate hydrolase|nr:amidohydrolase [Isosphaeraceae bacterium]